MEDVKQVKVKMSTWKELMYLKIEMGLSSVDEVIQFLLQKYKEQETPAAKPAEAAPMAEAVQDA